MGHGFSGVDCKFMWGVERLTGIRVFDKARMSSLRWIRNSSSFPISISSSPAGMYLTDEEAERLREYLLRGGFLHVDDFWGLRQRAVC